MAQCNGKEVFKKLLVDFAGEEDPLLCMLNWTAHQLMEIEAENKVGAAKRTHATCRTTHFSGTRVRRFDTRLGTTYLIVPKLRKGGYVPFFVSYKNRSEQALMSLVREAFINGVSTRKIERLAKSLGIEYISASQVSEINKGLNVQVQEFRTRPLDEEYPFVWIDALYEKVRENNRVISMAIFVAYAVNTQGKREILAVEPMYDESEYTWREFFRNLKTRGLQRVTCIISDAHRGIQSAVRKEFVGGSWQRCTVHFMRNILAHVPHRDKKIFAEKLKQIWLQPDKAASMHIATMLIEEYDTRFPDAIRCLQEGLEDSLQFYHFPHIDKRKISSVNVVERINREIRRRSRVISIFPNRESYIRLITCYLLEYTEDWGTEKGYIRQDLISEVISQKESAFRSIA